MIMTVRKITKTTLSVIALITGFVFLRMYYVGLLSRLIYKLSDDGYFFLISKRLLPREYMGAYYPGLFYFCVIIIIAVYLIDVILDHKAALKALSSFGLPLLLAAIVTIALCIRQINILQLWAIFYACMIICLHSTFKKMIVYSESTGRYVNLKLIKGFFLTIKDVVVKTISTNIKDFGNPVDETVILSASFMVLLLEVMAVISYGIYLATYWRLIFLSHLINSF
jgi:vacuolar-type H+-ATPase subunit I/STV1